MNTTHHRQQVVRIVQVIVLIIALLLERVIGLPIIFLGITLQTLDLTEKFSRRVTFLSAVVLLALVYQFSFLVSFMIISLGIIVWFGLQQFSSSKTARLALSTAVMVLALSMYLQVDFTFRIGLYGLISFLVIIGVARTTQTYT
jgi:hypothetical protein